MWPAAQAESCTKLQHIAPDGAVKILPLWNYIDNFARLVAYRPMPHSRMNELFLMAEANDGLFTSKQIREKGIQDSVRFDWHSAGV
jgi:hypothetical protein